MLRSALQALTLVALATSASAQIQKAPLSPLSRTSTQVGLAQVSLEYSRPGVKGRKIFGELEPYGRVWRTGANASTKITFDRDVQFGGEAVPAGTYGLYTIPEKKAWTVILSKNSKLWGAGGYDPAQDQVRVEVKPSKLKEVQETLLVDFDGFHANGAALCIAWEKTRVEVPVFVDSDAETLASIDERVRKATGEVSPQTYFDAAMFLYEKNGVSDETLEWVTKAVELQPNAFWMRYYQAEMAGAKGDKKLARSAAKEALSQAKSGGSGGFGYIAKCEILLKSLK